MLHRINARLILQLQSAIYRITVKFIPQIYLVSIFIKTSTRGSFLVYLAYMKKLTSSTMHRGFTVLEFLIVLVIIILLIAIMLPNLQTARERSSDEQLVADLKAVALGLEQYKIVCGDYPNKIEKDQQCNDNGNRNLGSATLGSFIPNIDKYKFNKTDSPYFYYPIAYNSKKTGECNGYHLGVQLKGTISGNVAVGDAQAFDSTSTTSFPQCDGSDAIGFVGSKENIYDIVR